MAVGPARQARSHEAKGGAVIHFIIEMAVSILLVMGGIDMLGRTLRRVIVTGGATWRMDSYIGVGLFTLSAIPWPW